MDATGFKVRHDKKAASNGHLLGSADSQSCLRESPQPLAMFLKLCLFALLATSLAASQEASKKFHHEQQKSDAKEKREGCCSDMEMISTEELKWGKRMLRSIHLANEAVKKLPKNAFYSDHTVCFDKVGCFDRLGGKFSHFASSPKSPEVIGTKFLLHSRLNKDIPVLLDYADNATLDVAHFNETKELVFVIHGFGASAKKNWVINLKEAFLNLNDVNVVLVDWRNGSKTPDYVSAAANSALVGRQMSLLIQQLIRSHPDTMNATQVYLVGFSLGAQVAGFCGRHFFNATGTKIGRITALDAAGPLFESYDFQVCKEDASYVDAIHTTAGSNVLAGLLGIESPFGHVNFYPNGGKSQPGCWFFDLFCHHRRSVQYFMESMQENRHCLFKSNPCDSIDSFLDSKCNSTGPHGEMGYFSDNAEGRGAQFLWTNGNNPFCKA
ncbi:pancreatic lipase-related protein 2-like [Dermacentor variabilis]|uniref:pancreatic lipase-related protein 2-like n=1 Tax=Dermacentor variabilis TaxID=34621 RepID=UPI003F5B478C